MSLNRWCGVCRGDDDMAGAQKCAGCQKRFHLECLGLKSAPGKGWQCDDCLNPVELTAEEEERRDAFLASQKLVADASKKQAMRRRSLLHQQQALLEPFVERKKMQQLGREANKESSQLESANRDDREFRAKACDSTQPSYTTATLREYQCEGINWMATMYEAGIGGILGDQMGLGKTLQALSFLAYLKKVRTLACVDSRQALELAGLIRV